MSGSAFVWHANKINNVRTRNSETILPHGEVGAAKVVCTKIVCLSTVGYFSLFYSRAQCWSRSCGLNGHFQRVCNICQAAGTDRSNVFAITFNNTIVISLYCENDEAEPEVVLDVIFEASPTLELGQYSSFRAFIFPACMLFGNLFKSLVCSETVAPLFKNRHIGPFLACRTKSTVINVFLIK